MNGKFNYKQECDKTILECMLIKATQEFRGPTANIRNKLLKYYILSCQTGVALSLLWESGFFCCFFYPRNFLIQVHPNPHFVSTHRNTAPATWFGMLIDFYWKPQERKIGREKKKILSSKIKITRRQIPTPWSSFRSPHSHTLYLYFVSRQYQLAEAFEVVGQSEF